ncbi:MAG: radical SAM/SPASM domain-containing protein [Syntrophobacteraceae bacterium]
MTEVPTEYGPLVRELHERAAKTRQPINGAFELTSACNLSCRMCYVRQSGSDRIARGKEMSAAQWLELARQAKDNGLLFLLLTGGEIFLRRDFFDIYEPLTRMGLVITLFTNGTLVTHAIAERLAQAPPSRTEITLYGATAATYEAITGVPGSYSACCEGIETLLANRVPLGLKTTITRYNVAELEEMRQMAQNWGLTFNGAWLLTQRPDGKPSDVENCRLSATECVELEATDRASANEMSEAALRVPPSDKDDNFYCKAGKVAFAVNPSGDMNACLILPAPGASTLESGFQAAWTQVGRYVDSALSPSPVCLSCDARVYCGRCPAWSLIETDTLTEPVPYWCDIAKARKKRYERPA